jgi:hypothetical protein
MHRLDTARAVRALKVVPAELAHGVEVNSEPPPRPAFDPLDTVHDYPAVVAQFLAARTVLAPTFNVHVGAAGFASRPTLCDQALEQAISHAQMFADEA